MTGRIVNTCEALLGNEAQPATMSIRRNKGRVVEGLSDMVIHVFPVLETRIRKRERK